MQLESVFIAVRSIFHHVCDIYDYVTAFDGMLINICIDIEVFLGIFRLSRFLDSRRVVTKLIIMKASPKL